MQILVNSDNHIESSIRLEEWVRTTIESMLERYEEDLTRIEVFLKDENGDKPGPHDLSCRLEARPKGHQPISVIHKADTLEQAIDGAATKLDNALEHLFGRLQGKPRAEKSTPNNQVDEAGLEEEFLENEQAALNS